ncbi:MAG TPA: preprotein translocase subunit SecE [Firmicutes bacterium]|nr:preprotein translocase subunit SecE [Bacillota bacterium]
MVEFFREVRGELRKVSWPDRHTTGLYTWVVAASVVVVGAAIWVIDVGLSSLLRLVIK